MDTRGPVLLARYLALAWLGLVVYGSLHPFSGWLDKGISPLAFLEGGWPRYWTAFDLVANVAVYLPLGFFLTLVCLLRSLKSGTDAGDNPWEATTLEWKTSSPPPLENFLGQPTVDRGPYDRAAGGGH